MKRFLAFISAALVAAVVIAFGVNHGFTFGTLGVALIGLAALDALAGSMGVHVLGTTGGSFTNLSDALKIRYDDPFLGRVTWSKGVAAAMIKKASWSGRLPAFKIRTGNTPARSASYAKTAAKSEDATYGFTRIKEAQVPWVRDYSRATIDGLVLRSAGDKSGTPFDDMVDQIDGALDATMHSFSSKVYRNGFGCIGNISTGTNLATTTLGLAIPEDVYLYEIGMDLTFSSADSTATLRNSGGILTVTAIQHQAGTLTVNAAINTNTGTTNGDFIFVDGDRQNSATPTRQALGGFDAWLPTAAPAGGENFYNLGDRNNDGRLLGTRIDTTTGTYAGATEEAAIIAAITEASRVGGKPRTAFLNPTRFENLILTGMARYRPTTVTGPANIGFSGVTFTTSYGDVRVFPDLFCPRQRGYVVDLDTWKVYGAGDSKIPTFLDHDGMKILRQTADDGVEARVGYYGAQGCNAPIQNAVIKFE